MNVWVVTNQDGKFLEVFADDKHLVRRSIEITYSSGICPFITLENDFEMIWDNGVKASRIRPSTRPNHL